MPVPVLNQLPDPVHLGDLSAKSLAAVTDHTKHFPSQNDLRVCVRWSTQRQQLYYSALIELEKLQSLLTCYLNVEQGWLLLGPPLTCMGCWQTKMLPRDLSPALWCLSHVDPPHFPTHHFISMDKTTPSRFLMTTKRLELKCHQHAALKAMRPLPTNLLLPLLLGNFIEAETTAFYSFRNILSTIRKIYPENGWPNSNTYAYF